nr:uncharacterized mitochondrial protein AtMg00810-like [Tanacetum cinerariifolium]
MFAVCACARHQVTPKECHLHAVKRIFRYIKGHPKLGLWYPKDSPFDLMAYSDSDYGGATQDRQSTTGGCQFLGRRLILWQCKNQTIMATSTTEAEYVATASGCGQVEQVMRSSVRGNHILCTNFIVDFLEASHIRYALTISPTVYVSHIRHWSTARRYTKRRTISKSSLRRHLKLNDKEGISSLPDTELFENLSLMGYNILPNQRFTFQKGQFSPQWKFLIHTIMQCLNPKSIGFNEFSSNITTAVVCLATNMVYNFSKMIFDGMVRNITNKPASLLRDDRQGEAFPTVSSLDAGHDRENINKTSALPHESSPRVTSLDADDGNMQQRLQELMELCTSLQRQQIQMAAKIKDQDLEISGLKERVKFLEDKDKGSAEPTQEDAPIKWGIMKTGEEVRADKSTELGSNDTDEIVNVLSSIEAANILTSEVAAVSVSLVAGVLTKGVPTVSGLFPTASAIFTTASMVTPYTRRPRGISAKNKGKEKVVESERLSEHLARDSEIARLHAEEELKNMIEGLYMSNEVIVKHLQEYEQAAADLSVGEKIELINELMKYQDHHANILKYQAQQSKPLSKKEKREFYMSVLISHAGWKTRHFKGMALEEIKEKFIPVWKQLEDFVPMSSKEEGERVKRQGLKIDQGSSKRMKTSEDVSEEDLKWMMQLVPLEEVYVEAPQVKHLIIYWEIHSKEKREYWKIIRLGGHTTVYQFFVDMLKQFDREDLHQLWTLVKETLSIKQATKDKEKELWVELKRLFEPDFEDQLWTHNQALMHDPLEWKLYDTCGVHYVFTKDQEIFMLVEKGLSTKEGTSHCDDMQ